MYYYVVISTKLLSFLKNKIKKIKNIQQKMPDSSAATCSYRGNIDTEILSGNWLLAALDCNNCINSIILSLAVIIKWLYNMLKGIMVQWFNVLNCETINALTTPEVNLSARILYSSVGEGRFLVFYYCHILLLYKRFFF